MFGGYVKTVCFYSHLNCKALCFIFAISIWCPARFPYQLMIVYLTVTRRARWVPLVEQVLIILRSSSFFGYVQIVQSLVFCVVSLYLYMSFLLDIVFSVFRFTASSYILSIFKLVLSTDGRHCYGCKTTLPFQPSVCIRIKQTSYRNEN